MVETIATVAKYFTELDNVFDSPCVYFMYLMFDGENQCARKAITTSNQIAIIDLSRQVKVPLELLEVDD